MGLKTLASTLFQLVGIDGADDMADQAISLSVYLYFSLCLALSASLSVSLLSLCLCLCLSVVCVCLSALSIPCTVASTPGGVTSLPSRAPPRVRLRCGRQVADMEVQMLHLHARPTLRPT